MTYQIPVDSIAIDGILGYPGNGFGGIPIKFLANIPNAVWMRVANTPEELILSDWLPYSPESTFWVRTGFGSKSVYAEFGDFNGSVISTKSEAIPAFDESLGINYSIPGNEPTPSGNSNILWQQSFNAGFERWVAYDYSGPTVDGSNWFYPASWNATGGLGNSGYAWVDDSRWRIDTPESPNSILSLLTYSQWNDFPNNPKFNLNGSTIEFYLKGSSLDLKGGSAYFWVVDDHGRWKQMDAPLVITEDAWTFNSVNLGFDSTGWENSWHGFNGSPLVPVDWREVRSWGIAFVGFTPGIEPTGVIGIDEFSIKTRSEFLVGNDAGVTLIGGRGDDTILGGNGDDILIDGGGIDSINGLLGDDSYEISNALSHITETIGGGRDRVLSTASYALAPGQEIEILSTQNNQGTESINLTGNEFNNWIYGNAGDNILDSGGGIDGLIGREGNDWYFIQSSYDSVRETIGGGRDRVLSTASYALAPGQEIEILSTQNNQGTESINLTGNEFNNWIYGNAGDNILDSGGGIDGLIGREGNDSFLFGNLNNGSDNIGFIMDFNSSDDSILLSSSIFTGLDLGALDSSNFYIDPINPISTGAAISYQSSDGSISYWNDGVSTQFANLLVGIAIDSSDFIVI